MNRGETGQKICRSRLRAENCSTWNNFVSREQGGILKLFHVEQFDSPSGAFSAPNRHWRIPSGPSRDRSALGGEGIPKIVPRGTILSDPASIPEAYRFAGAFLREHLRLPASKLFHVEQFGTGQR
jgi:hypothetical protein